MEQPTTLAHCWLSMSERQSPIAIRVRQSGGWRDLSWADYRRDIEKAGAGLLALGLKKGDRVAIMANTRYEWAVADFGVLAAGAVTVPIYHNNGIEDVEFILNDSGASVFIAENQATLKMWRKIADRCPSVRKVVSFETDDPGDPSLLSWDALLEMGADHLASNPDAVLHRARAVEPTDIATLLYTSGTTGQPKGVVIAHEQGISEISESFPLCGVTEKDVSLSFLPYAHILGRIELWGHAYIGFTMAFAEGLEKVRGNLGEIRPTILVSVPRIFEKIHGAVYAQMENQPLKRTLFNWAMDIGRRVGERRLTRRLVPLPLLAQYEAARLLVLDKVREAFGGRLRFAISGGAPLERDIATFFHAAGILVLEGYGLTETTAAITVNTPFNYRFGSVGRPIGDVELKLAEDGEILVRSKKVMREYWKNPAATREVFVDGWFRTGDIGEILPSGDLKITDRKKDLIKTAGGKYVAPQKIEALLKLNPVIGHALVHGDQKKYIVALLTLDRPYVENFAREAGLPSMPWTDLVQHPRIQTLVRQAVSDANARLASWESVKRYTVLSRDFTVEGGELTPSLKVKRKALDERFREKIEALYG